MNREFLVSLVVLVNLACALGAKSIFSNWFIASGRILCVHNKRVEFKKVE